MPAHPKPHPLAHRFVVPNGFLLTGQTVRVIDWLDRCGEDLGALVQSQQPVSVRCDDLRFAGGWAGEAPIAPDQAVAALSPGWGLLILEASQLPTYDPVPMGSVS